MTADDRVSHLENRLDNNEKTLHEHMLEDVRVLAQIPHQLEALKEGTAHVREEIRGAREEIRGVHDTLERHSSRILNLEQAPNVAAASLQKTVGSKLLDAVIKWGVPALICVFTYFGAGIFEALTVARPVPVASPSPTN